MATVLVTGANRGIGLALIRRFKQRGDLVVAACRAQSKELGAAGVRVIDGVDVTSPASLATLGQGLEGLVLDVVVLNAGVLIDDDLATARDEDILRQFEVNALGPLRCVRALLTRLREGSKVALISSRMASIADNSSGGSYGYRMSKAALNAAGASLAIDLRNRGVAVGILHPGWVKTDMTSHAGHVTADESARGLIARIDGLTLETSGEFRHMSGERLPW